MPRTQRNNVRRLREELLLSKAELARRAGLSPLTIDRVERGEDCRMDTMRKIILALGLTVGDKAKVFGGAEPARRKPAAKVVKRVAVRSQSAAKNTVKRREKRSTRGR